MLTAVRRRRPSSARRFAAWAAAPFLLAVGLAPMALAAPTASASTVARPTVKYTEYVLVAAPTTRSSSTHKSLKVVFEISANNLGEGVSDTVGVDLLGRSGVETHDWQFNAPSSAIKASATSLTLSSGSALGTYGSVKLSTTASGSSKSTCLAGFKVTNQSVSVKETFSFNTRSTGSNAWGTVSGSGTVAKGSIASFTETPCSATPNDCSAGNGWTLVQIKASGGYVFIGTAAAPSTSESPATWISVG